MNPADMTDEEWAVLKAEWDAKIAHVKLTPVGREGWGGTTGDGGTLV